MPKTKGKNLTSESIYKIRRDEWKGNRLPRGWKYNPLDCQEILGLVLIVSGVVLVAVIALVACWVYARYFDDCLIYPK